VVFCVGHAWPRETHRRGDLPAAVQESGEKSRGAAVRDYASETRDGQLEYEVEMIAKGVSTDSRCNVLELEEQWALHTFAPKQTGKSWEWQEHNHRLRRIQSSSSLGAKDTLSEPYGWPCL
jgi:hypothetical protein